MGVLRLIFGRPFGPMMDDVGLSQGAFLEDFPDFERFVSDITIVIIKVPLYCLEFIRPDRLLLAHWHGSRIASMNFAIASAECIT